MPFEQFTFESVFEEWRPIVGYETFYSVSDQGRILRNRRSNRWPAGRVFRPCAGRGGYLSVHLFKGTKMKTHTVHSLVAAAFIGPRPIGQQVNHKNGDRAFNVLGNLEYMTPKENTRHAYRVLHRRPSNLPGVSNPASVGECNGRAIFTENDVREIRRLYATGTHTQQVIAERFGTTRGVVSLITRRVNWKHVV